MFLFDVIASPMPASHPLYERHPSGSTLPRPATKIPYSGPSPDRLLGPGKVKILELDPRWRIDQRCCARDEDVVSFCVS